MDEADVRAPVEALSDDSRAFGEQTALVVDLNRKFSCWRDDENLRELAIRRFGLDALVH